MSAHIPKGKPQADINITPLVDILLVILIIFMIITPILQKGHDGSLPPRSSKGAGEAIVLQISADGTLAINRTVVAEKDLGSRLEAIFTARQEKTLFVDAEDRASYERVVQILDICRGPGRAQDVGFVLN